MASSHKAGRVISRRNMNLLQAIYSSLHEILNNAQVEASSLSTPDQSKAFVVQKGSDGLRYIGLITSNAYIDRDGEILAEKALKAWVDSAWKDGEYIADNPLLFWHAGEPIGDVIWSDMRGAFLVEVAKERDTPFAKTMFDVIERDDIEWGVSHGFQDKSHEWDGNTKVYKRIDKKETSVLPLAFAANPHTSVKVKNMGIRLNWLKKNAPEAAKLEGNLSREAKSRQAKLESSGAVRKGRKGRKSGTLNIKELDTEKLIDGVATLIDEALAEADIDTPEDLDERVASVVESLEGGDAPVESAEVVETLVQVSEEILADAGADAPEELESEIETVIEEAVDESDEVASSNTRRSRKGRVPRKSQKSRSETQTELIEALLDDLSILTDIAPDLKSVSAALKTNNASVLKEVAALRRDLAIVKRRLSGGIRAASDDDETEVEEGDEDDDTELRSNIKSQGTKERSSTIFGDLYSK